MRATGRAAPELLERAPQLGALHLRMQEAMASEGSLTLVLGEAGVGKTALVRAVTVDRPRGMRLLWGACDALSTPRPLAPLHDIALTAGGELAAVMASDASKHERLGAALAELVAPRPPTVLVIEDVHWADEATRDLLVFLSRRIGTTRAAIVVTARDDELARDHPLTGTIGRLVPLPAVRSLELQPLGRDSVTTLAAGLDADAVYAATGGNPFFVTELVEAHSTDAVPSSVRAAVLARADALGPEARRALDAAALVPRSEVDVGVVLAVAGVSGDAVDECLRSGVLQGRPGRIAFRHELARRAVEASVPPATAAALHRRILAEFERRGADPARLVHHAELAGDADRTARYALAAAVAASRVGAHRSAMRQYERAIASGALTQERAAAAWEGIARECSAFADDAGALDACERARAIWRRLGRFDEEGRALAMSARALWDQGSGAEAHRVAALAVEHFRDRPDGPAKAIALSIAAQLHMLAREVDKALAVGRRAADLAARTGEDGALAGALNALGSALWFVDPDKAESPLVRGRDVAERLGDDIAVGVALINLGSGAGEIRRYAQAERWLTDAVAWCADRDLDRSGGYATAWLARVRLEQGDAETARRLAEPLCDDPGVTTRIVALTVMGRLRVRAGAQDADGPLREAWTLAERTGDLQRLWPVAAGLAESAWSRSETPRIPDLVSETYRRAVELRQAWPIGELGFWLWRAGALHALPSNAADPFAAHTRGDLATAVALWDRLGCRYEAAAALADGGPAELVEAIARFDALGARPAADAAAARLRVLAADRMPRRPRRATAANPAGLTARELQVAALISAGQTDAEIAGRLHISVKTAGHHVSAILAKLDVASRVDVAAAATRRGLSLS